MRDVQRVFRGNTPREVEYPVQVGPAHRILGGGLVHLREPLIFLFGHLQGFFGKARRIDPLAQLSHLHVPVFLPELLPDRLHLLTEVVLPLPLVDPVLDLRLNLAPELELLQELRERQRQFLHPLPDLAGFQDLLFFGDTHRNH